MLGNCGSGFVWPHAVVETCCGCAGHWLQVSCCKTCDISSEKEVKLSREADHEGKLSIQEKINLSKYINHSNFVPGDVVLVRDCARKSNFSPVFLSEPFVVTELDDVAKLVILEGLGIQKVIVRHLDDMNEFHGSHHLPQSQAYPVGQGQLSDAEMTAHESHLIFKAKSKWRAMISKSLFHCHQQFRVRVVWGWDLGW